MRIPLSRVCRRFAVEPRPPGDGGSNAPDRLHALALAALGDALLASGRMAESLTVLQSARAQLLSSQPNSSPDVADIAIDLARAQIGLGRGDDAVAAVREATDSPGAPKSSRKLARLSAEAGCATP